MAKNAFLLNDGFPLQNRESAGLAWLHVTGHRIKVTDLKDIVLSLIGDSIVKNLAESSELVI